MKIFDTQPKPGMPVRHGAFYRAIVRMAKAWETLAVDGGHVSWSGGKPTIVVDGGGAGETGGMDYSEFAFGFTISGAVVSLNAGEVHIGSKSIYDVSATERTLTADHQYLWVEFLIGASTSPAWALPNTQRPKSDAVTYRQWFYQFRFADGVGSLERVGHLGNIELPGSYA